MTENRSDLLRNVLISEGDALVKASEKLTPDIADRIWEIFEYLKTEGSQLVVCGVGKSGHVGRKIAATFSSLGLPSTFLHPVEALHGDLGAVQSKDVALFISKSGNTEEIVKLLPYFPIPQENRIGILGKVDSPIGDQCELILDGSVEKEACLNNQAPTTSATLALALGDALAVYFEHFSGLTKEKFAENHPAGLLGKSLRLRVSDLMMAKDDCPVLNLQSTLKEVVLLMTQKAAGACVVLDENQKMLGLIVEGDFRRYLGSHDQPNLNEKAAEIMNKSPLSISFKELALDALKKMELGEKQVSVLPVVDESSRFVGLIRVHDILKEGLSL